MLFRSLSLSQDSGDEDAEKKRSEELRRSGLTLNDPALLEAWENGEDKRYIPVKFKGGVPSGDALASLEQLGQLSRHIKDSLSDMARALRQGSIAADPYYRNQKENACLNCEFFEACHFADGEGGESARYMPKLTADRVWGMLGEVEEHA